MKVLISDHLSPQGIEVLKRGGLQVEVRTKLTPEELIREMGGYEGLVIRSGTQVTSAVIEAAGRLKVIGRAGSGLDNVDLDAATRRGIVVMNTPGGNTVTTAEHTMALLLSLARAIPQATASVKAGRWEKQKFMGVELYNKNLGVIGLGQIGGYVAKLAQGFMMNVIAFDPYLSEDRAKKMGIEQVTLEDLFRRSDFISIHTPLTPETKNLINAQSIAKMKDGVRIVNCARGGIVNEADLYQALVAKKVAGAAFDVFEKEPADSQNPLLTLDNFICSPHLGAATTEAQENVALAIAEQIVDYLVHGVIRNAVNLPSIPADILPAVRPYLILAEKLGAFAAQVLEGGLEKVAIEYRGDVANLATTPITVAALRGLLNPILEDSVNYVNAPVIAKERGIEIKETRSTDAGDFTSLIILELQAGKGVVRVGGTLYRRKDPRIVDLNGFPLEVVPEGHMLVLSNLDQPGVIGSLGNFLGRHQINIASMQLGREKPGGKAISVIGIDASVTPDLLQEIKKLPHILSAKQIKL
ncbi:MAG TPA: phosphoglycerate dehydrogenase [Nitrospiria bacterium]|nr:phosphoglycerate dehydrogenase [Nitrospiria bacterium]